MLFSAAQRIAVQLGEVIQTIQSVADRLHYTLEHEHWDRLIALVGEVLENLSADKQYHSIEQSDSEDVLSAWLREGGVSDAWKIAPMLVGAGLEMSALISLRELLPKNAFGDALRWFALRLKIQTLLDDAEQSTGRIASLVEAVRSIVRQERAEAADIDVHEQLRSALGVLDHKLKNARVALSDRLLFVALARLFRQRQPHLLDAIAALIETPSGSGRPPTRSDRCAMARAACR